MVVKVKFSMLMPCLNANLKFQGRVGARHRDELWSKDAE